jgi:hypothetical protein
MMHDALRFQKKHNWKMQREAQIFAMAKAFIQTLSFGKRRRRILLVVPRQNQNPPNNKIRIRHHQERERERQTENSCNGSS